MADFDTPRLVDGPDTARATVLLAHGAGAPMDSPFMAAMASGLADRGWRVVRFEFAYMAKQRFSGRKAAPDRLPKLQEVFRQQVALELAKGPVIIGGKSMGGRVASLLLDELPVLGGVCLGYPFHPLGKPEQLRTEHLRELKTPTLILQGERDGFGHRNEVEGYELSPSIRLQWLADGDHSFKPRKSSGLSEAQNWQQAVEAADDFCRGLLSR